MAGFIFISLFANIAVYTVTFILLPKMKKNPVISTLCAVNWKKEKTIWKVKKIETIYLGGGTPSQLEYKDFELIFQTLGRLYDIQPNAEITIEANPDDLTSSYVSMLREFPFNRLSMGIQTFQEDILRLLHRRHTAQQAIDAFERCRKAGFKNISIDLMYGLPGESMQTWESESESGYPYETGTHIGLSPDL